MSEKLLRCTVTFYLSWRHISVVKVAKLDLAAFTAWSQVSNSDELMIGRASKLSLQFCSRATLLSDTNLSRCHLICHCTPGSTRCPVKVNVPDTGASSTSGFAFRANVFPVVVPCIAPAFGSTFARVSLLVIEPGTVAVG